MKKKLFLMFCMVSCLLMVTGCSLTKENKNLSEAKLSQSADEFVEQWFGSDFETMVSQYGEQLPEAQVELLKESAVLLKKHGAMKKIVRSEFTTASDTATVVKTVSTEKGGKLVITVTFDEKGEISNWKAEEYQSVSQVMGRAALNTVMSMAIVFCVLIFISLLISCFKYINKAQEDKKPASQPAAVAEVTVEEPVEEDLADDLELVAVITAAIAAASENECTDGLMVRSIVRRP